MIPPCFEYTPRAEAPGPDTGKNLILAVILGI
jgi:hypothetical protein